MKKKRIINIVTVIAILITLLLCYTVPAYAAPTEEAAQQAEQAADIEAQRREAEQKARDGKIENDKEISTNSGGSSGDGTTTGKTLDDIIKAGDKFINSGKNAEKISDDKIKDMSDTVWNILMSLGIIIAVVVGLILGIKFITSGIEEQAKVKEMLVPYAIGCIVLFGSVIIWKIVVNVLGSM